MIAKQKSVVKKRKPCNEESEGKRSREEK